jgi:hypothetical protein
LAKYTGVLNGWEELYRVHSGWSKLANAGAGGYMNGHPGRGTAISLTVYMPNTTAAHLQGVVRSAFSFLGPKAAFVDPSANVDSAPGSKSRIVGRFTEYTSYEAARDSMTMPESELAAAQRPATGTGATKIVASWLWSAKDIGSPKLKQALRGAFDAEAQMMTDGTMGVGTKSPPYLRGGGNAVNPALRTAIMRPAAELHWEGSDPARLARKMQDAARFSASLRSLAPDGGTYANEADPSTPNWQHAFWGANYARLLSIKQKADPSGVFYCRLCVGSEFFEDQKGVLCRKKI